MNVRQLIRRLGQYIRLYLAFISLYMRRVFEYRTDLFLGFGTHLVRSAMGLLLVWALFTRIQVIQGWNAPEVMLIYGLAVTTAGLTSVIGVCLFGLGRDMILTGHLDRLLLRPRNTLFLLMSEGINDSAFGQVVTGLAALGWACAHLPDFWNAARLAWLVAALGCGTLIFYSIILLSVTVCFWYETEWGLLNATEPLGSLAQYPLDIYNAGVRFILTWIVPFGFTAFLPAAALLRPQEYGIFYWIIPLFSLGFFTVAYAAWKAGLNHYVGAGH
jgi:ABC-2 type transport system permease protein